MIEKKRGRPTKAPTPGERVSLGLRVTADMKDRIDGAAASNGRSQSQEVEYRLERSFADEGLFSSPELRFWAIYQAGRFSQEGRYHASAKGHPEWSDKDWMADGDCRTAATFEVIDSLIKDLIQVPSASIEDIAIYIESLKSRLINNLVSAGKAKLVWKDDDNG